MPEQLPLFDFHEATRPTVDECPHRSGFITQAYVPAGFHCCGCGQLLWQQIPKPPEVLGYVSADWAWKHRHGRVWTSRIGDQVLWNGEPAPGNCALPPATAVTPVVEVNPVDFQPTMPAQARRTKKAKPGPKPGTPSPRKRWEQGTKVARVPADWDVDHIAETLDGLRDVIEGWEDELKDSAKRSASKRLTSPRYQQVAKLLQELREWLP